MPSRAVRLQDAPLEGRCVAHSFDLASATCAAAAATVAAFRAVGNQFAAPQTHKTSEIFARAYGPLAGCGELCREFGIEDLIACLIELVERAGFA